LTQALSKILPFSFGLYIVALATSMAGMEIFSWLSFLLVMIIWFREKSLFVAPPSKSWMLPVALMLWSAVTVVANGFTGLDLKWTLGDYRWIVLLLSFFLILQVFSGPLGKVTPKGARSFFIFLLSLFVIIGIYGILQYFYGWDLVRGDSHRMSTAVDAGGRVLRWRSRGFFSMPLTFAYSFGMMMMILLPFVVSRPKPINGLWLLRLLAVTLGYVAIFLSYTRGAWIAMALSTGVLLSFTLSWKKLGAAAIAAIAGLVGIIVASPHLKSRIFSILDMSHRSNSDRLFIWQANWNMFKDHPLFGIGHNIRGHMQKEYLDAIGADVEYVGHAHNNLMQYLSATGVLGGVLFAGVAGLFLIYSYRLIRRYRDDSFMRNLSIGLLSAQILFHGGGITECNFFDAEVRHLLIFVWALVIFIYQKPDGLDFLRFKSAPRPLSSK